MTQQQLLDNRTRIGQRVRDIRIEREMTQGQLAAAANIRQATLSNIENGEFSVGIDVLAKIANELDCVINLVEQ